MGNFHKLDLKRLVDGETDAQPGSVEGIHAIDAALFRWLNRDMSAPWLDPVAAFLTGNRIFVPAMVLGAVALVWRGGARGRVLVVALGLSLGIADGVLIRPLKSWAGRSRPFVTEPLVVLRVGRGSPQGSMPSNHAMNVAAMAAVALWYYRRAGWVAAVVAVGVGWSRIYNGVHYPTDVLAGFALGIATVAMVLVGMEWGWKRGVGRVRPNWVKAMPSVLWPGVGGTTERASMPTSIKS